MPKKAQTEEQIVAVLQQGQAGEKVGDICRKVGISEGTYYGRHGRPSESSVPGIVCFSVD